MKTTILLGYSKTDSSGNPLGAATVISGPPENEKTRQAQAKLFHDAKFSQKFPKGVKHLQFCTVDVAESAAQIETVDVAESAAQIETVAEEIAA